MLNEMQHLPDALYDAGVTELVDILDGPTLFHLEGKEKKPLFISTLLHGNETTGFLAIQRILKRYRDTGLPRSVSLFLGNIEAARANQRHMDSQDDYNRIWPGTRHADSPEKDMMQTVTDIMERRKPFASIDIHNNTGKNPHYACINILNPHGLELASQFSDIAVYFTSPKGVQSLAFSDFCPSLVLECGQSADVSGVDHAVRFIDTVLHMDALGKSGHGNLKLYHTIARVTIPASISMADSVQESSSDILLNAELEDMNFRQPELGTLFARKLSDKTGMLTVTSESNEDITAEYLDESDGDYRIKRPVTLSMFTTNQRAIRQDCVCYFMEELRIG